MTLTADIRCRTGSFVLDVALRADPGEVVAVLGPNGSGKSTLLGAIAGHRSDVEGSVILGARTLDARVPAEERRIGLLGQRALLFPHLTALENVAFGPRAQGVARTTARAQARTHLGAVGLEDLADRRPHELSGGQRQRVAIARALAPGARFIVADEPVSMLDVSIRLGVLNLLAELQREENLGVLYITHDLATARHFSDDIMVLFQGDVVERGTADEVILSPQHEYTKTLLAAAPEPENLGRLRDEVRAELALGS